MPAGTERMRESRAWSEWPRGTVGSLGAASGLLSLGGVAISVAGVATGTAATPFIVAIGALTVSATVGWAAHQGFPELRYIPEVGEEVSPESLDTLRGQVVRIGVLGVGGVGKTTLMDHIRRKPSKKQTTERPYATLISLPNGRHVALIDGPGQSPAEQRGIAERADFGDVPSAVDLL